MNYETMYTGKLCNKFVIKMAHIYIYVCVCVCVCVYTHTHTHTQVFVVLKCVAIDSNSSISFYILSMTHLLEFSAYTLGV